MNHEIEEKADLEKYRAVNVGLATNPATSKDFILKMLEEEQQTHFTSEEWTTPRSVKEIEEFLRLNA